MTITKSNVPMVGDSVSERLVKELNRRISNVEIRKDIDDEGDKDIEILDIKVSVIGIVPADSVLHVEILCKGYEHTVFIEDLPLTRLSKAKLTKNYAFGAIRYEVQNVIDQFLKEMAEHTNRGAYGKAIIHPSFCA